MRFDTASIGFLRNPYGDESLHDLIRAAAVCDAGLKVGTLIQCIDMPELRVDLLSPDSGVFAHFKKFHPDILIIPSELLGENLFAELTLRLGNGSCPMPVLFNVGNEPPEDARELIGSYPKCIHIGRGDPFVNGARVRRIIARELLNRESLHRRLRDSAALTLRAMHAEGGAGFEHLLDEVTIVLENSYVFFGTAAALHRFAAERRNVSAVTIEQSVRPIVEKAVSAMTDEEYSLCFYSYISRGIRPGIPEFVYAAAELTARSCSRLISLIHSEAPPTYSANPRYIK